MNNRQKAGLIAALVTALAGPGVSQAAINVDRTRIIMSSDAKAVSVGLSNESRDQPYLAQSWVEDSQGKATNVLIALPPLQRIDAGKKSRVRIMRVQNSGATPLPADRESLFYFNVREIPPAPDDKSKNILQLATQSQLKLFLRPATLAAEGSAAPEQKLEVLQSGRTLTLKNPTPYYVTLIWLGQSPKHKLAGFKEGTMVAPFSEQTVNTVPPAGDQLLVGNIDDYGAMRMNRFTCTAEKCTFRERIHE
ncbi:fimbrial chaperone protein StdC [Salmonella enterica]|uniref:Fimbrial chaperone protein StdC n=1 Tax=Salmonella enterica TaxID=28901 RepID=A0A5U1J9B1_SALER|nr:fimbria/pilus periplasmic chaperone [Salmonella enterica]EBG7972152.1 fimbrial chaperone protein StdC [Salmonella enterica subsp. enterica serovar Newport]EBP4088012.1 fimbria/pilus periplasmic chaperone [Salmonella enterica subsp. enterica]ECD5879570.1 fimbrial chaperone protein StdC [Salmonella enterica subsp. enterica serovar Poona]ECM0310155.1 fimbria/pilus periplasmic chaperone [Salmonella enterica subsp. enterica serovar Enteritidis]EDN4631017.1 fimbria/pilus periplasmic chaperone [Sa